MKRRVAVRVRNAKGSLVTEIELSKLPLVIGRGRPGEADIEADLAIDDARCSRRHALLEEAENGIWLTDQNSTNGSFSTEGKRLQRLRIRNRTRVRLGNHWLEFRMEGDEDCTVVEPFAPARPGSASPELDCSLALDLDPPPLPARAPTKTPSPVSAAAPSAGESPAEASREIELCPHPDGAVAAASRGQRALDLIDTVDRWLSIPAVSLTLLALSCARVAYWEVGSSTWQCVAGLGTAAATILGAMILAAATLMLARLADRRPEFRRLVFSYLTFLSLRQLCALLVSDAQLLWPEERLLEPWLPLAGSALVGLYLLFNGRWIQGARLSRIIATAMLWLIYMGLSFIPELRSQPPLWQKIVTAPRLIARAHRVPAAIEVPEAQFFHEMGQSLATLHGYSR